MESCYKQELAIIWYDLLLHLQTIPQQPVANEENMQ